MQEGDLDDVMRIEKLCFKTPWKRIFFADDIRRPTSSLMVAQVDGKLVGYCVAWLVADEVHLANIAVDPDWQRQGIGDRMLTCILTSCREAGCRDIYLEVRAGNIAALEFYRKYGFRHSFTRRGYYPDGEDALVMERELQGNGKASASPQ